MDAAVAVGKYNSMPGMPLSILDGIPKAIALGTIGMIIASWSAFSGHEVFLFIGAALSLYGLYESIHDYNQVRKLPGMAKSLVVFSAGLNTAALIWSGAQLLEEYN